MNSKTFQSPFEALRGANGAYIAAPHYHYEACWIRDQLYCALGDYHAGSIRRFKEGVRAVFYIFHKHRDKIEFALCHPPASQAEYIHAKYHPETLDEITHEWGHHQIDAIGLFLYVVSFAHKNSISVAVNREDRDMLQLLVQYLMAVRCWEFPDNGMWEEGLDMHASSIGAVVAGLISMKETGLAAVPNILIQKSYRALQALLPNESSSRDVDMAQLSLVWPYAIVTPATRDEILRRVKEKLAWERGVNRYWGDSYYQSENGLPAQWPMGFFWLAIIHADMGERESAREWYRRGADTTTKDGKIPELYSNGAPNEHTPLAWAHAMALVASQKISK